MRFRTDFGIGRCSLFRPAGCGRPSTISYLYGVDVAVVFALSGGSRPLLVASYLFAFAIAIAAEECLSRMDHSVEVKVKPRCKWPSTIGSFHAWFTVWK